MKTKNKVLVTLSLSAAALGFSVVTGGAAQAGVSNNCPWPAESTVIFSEGQLNVGNNGSVTGRLTGSTCGSLSGGTQTGISGKVNANKYSHGILSEGRGVSSEPLTIATKIGRTTVVSRYSDPYASCYYDNYCYMEGYGSYTLVGRKVSGAIPRNGSAYFWAQSDNNSRNNGQLVEVLNPWFGRD